MRDAPSAGAGILQFGSAACDGPVVLRPGAYAVVVDDAGRIAVLDTPVGRMLPGGGLDDDESAEAAAVRETAEECGLAITLERALGVADELVHARAEATTFRKRGSFFLARVAGATARVDTDHVLAWVAPGEAIATLAHASQAWAVRQALAPDGDR